MKIHYNRTGAQRKELVKAISNITGEKAKYLGMPSCAYQIGPFHLDKSGTVEYDEEDVPQIGQIILELMAAGFNGEMEDMAAEGTVKIPQQEPHSEEEKENAMELTISIPYEGFDEISLQNLDNLVKAKGSLIKKALGVEELPIKVQGEEIKFPWFKTTLDNDETVIYTTFISKLAEMAKTQKRINAKEKEVTNEKYAFRCFLLRLGLIGNGYKPHRKLLLSKLEGSSAFKAGKPE